MAANKIPGFHPAASRCSFLICSPGGRTTPKVRGKSAQFPNGLSPRSYFVWIFSTQWSRLLICNSLVQEGLVRTEHFDQVVLNKHMTTMIRSGKHTSRISIDWIFSSGMSKVKDAEKGNEIVCVGIMFDMTKTMRLEEKYRIYGIAALDSLAIDNLGLLKWFAAQPNVYISNFRKSRMFSVKQPNRIIHSLGKSERRLSKAKPMIIPPWEWATTTTLSISSLNKASLICAYATLASLVVYPQSRWIKHSARSRISPPLTGLDEKYYRRRERFVTNTINLSVEKDRKLIDGGLKPVIANHDSVDKEPFFVIGRGVFKSTWTQTRVWSDNLRAPI